MFINLQIQYIIGTLSKTYYKQIPNSCPKLIDNTSIDGMFKFYYRFVPYSLLQAKLH